RAVVLAHRLHHAREDPDAGLAERRMHLVQRERARADRLQRELHRVQARCTYARHQLLHAARPQRPRTDREPRAQLTSVFRDGALRSLYDDVVLSLQGLPSARVIATSPSTPAARGAWPAPPDWSSDTPRSAPAPRPNTARRPPAPPAPGGPRSARSPHAPGPSAPRTPAAGPAHPGPAARTPPAPAGR